MAKGEEDRVTSLFHNDDIAPMSPVREAWLKSLIKDTHSQRNNIQFNEVISTNPEYLATIKTPEDLIPFGVLKNFKTTILIKT